MKGLVDWLVDL